MAADGAGARRLLVARARAADPSIEEGPGSVLAGLILDALAENPRLSPVDLARRLVAQHPEADPSWINALAVEASREL